MSKYMQDMLDRQAYIDQNIQKKSPFDEGVMRAVKSAKQSLALDEDQSDRATREGLYGFSEALQQDQAPIAKGGILGRLATAARGVPSGMRAYDQAEDAGVKQNSMLADMAHRFRAAEEAKIAKMEQDAYMREMNDRKMAMEQEKLSEMRDYHKQSLLAKMDAKNNQLNDSGIPFVQSGKFTKSNNKLTENRLTKQYEVASNLVYKIDNIKNDYLELQKLMEEAGVPFNDASLQSLSKIPLATSLIASFRDENDPYRKIAEKVGKIRSETERLAMEYEAADKQRGLTDFTVKYANNRSLFPKIGESVDFLAKLDKLKEDAELSSTAADASLRYGINVNKNNYKDFLAIKNQLEQQGQMEIPVNNIINEQQSQPVQQPDKVLMIDPETGEQDYVDASRVEEAKTVDGLQIVNE